MKEIENFSAYLLTETGQVVTKKGEFEVKIENNKVTLKNDRGEDKTVSLGYLKEMAIPIEATTESEEEKEDAAAKLAAKSGKKEEPKAKDKPEATPEPETTEPTPEPEEKKASIKKIKAKKKAPKAKGKKDAKKTEPKNDAKKTSNGAKKVVSKEKPEMTVVKTVKEDAKTDKSVSLSQKIRDLYTDKKTERSEIHKILGCTNKYVLDVTWRHDNPGGLGGKKKK